jgi:hypothetical protein
LECLERYVLKLNFCDKNVLTIIQNFEVEADFPKMLWERQVAIIHVIKMLPTINNTLNSISERQDAEVSSTGFVCSAGVLIPDTCILLCQRFFSFRITIC